MKAVRRLRTMPINAMTPASVTAIANCVIGCHRFAFPEGRPKAAKFNPGSSGRGRAESRTYVGHRPSQRSDEQ